MITFEQMWQGMLGLFAFWTGLFVVFPAALGFGGALARVIFFNCATLFEGKDVWWWQP